jgi:hypothetical protein
LINNKILINSSPRSGTTWLQYILYRHKISLLKDIEYGGKIYADAFILRVHTPVALLAKFDDITQTTILRNPVDLIPSVLTKVMSGLGNAVVSGTAQPHEYDFVSLDRLIMEHFSVYRNYAHGIEKNIKNLKPFTFEQVTSDIEYVVKSLLGIDAKNSDIDSLKEDAKKQIRVHDKGDPGFNNAVPVEKKPDPYDKAKDMLLNTPGFDKVQKLYEDSKSLILDEQSKWI